MKYFTNCFVYTIKVVISILSLIYVLPHTESIFIVSLTVSIARIFIVCPAIRHSQLLLCLFLLLYKSINLFCSFTLKPTQCI